MIVRNEEFDRVQDLLRRQRGFGSSGASRHGRVFAGSVPGVYGYANDQVSGAPASSAREVSRVGLMFELAGKGWSLARIVAHLNEMDTDGSR